MKPMKVIVTEELDAKVRRKAAELKGLRKGVLSEAVSEALERWVGEREPELYIGVFEDGLSLEIPSGLVWNLLGALVKTLRPKRIRVYYRKGDREISKSCGTDLSKALLDAGISPLDPHFVADFGGVRFYTGGEGCIALEGNIPVEKGLQIVESILSGMGVRAQLPRKKPLHIQVRDGRLEVL